MNNPFAPRQNPSIPIQNSCPRLVLASIALDQVPLDANRRSQRHRAQVVNLQVPGHRGHAQRAHGLAHRFVSSVAITPPCRQPRGPSKAAETVVLQITERFAAIRNSSCSPVGFSAPQPKQWFCAAWGNGVRDLARPPISSTSFCFRLQNTVRACAGSPAALPSDRPHREPAGLTAPARLLRLKTGNSRAASTVCTQTQRSGWPQRGEASSFCSNRFGSE